MGLEDFTLKKLNENIDLSSFDCGLEDINEFLREDSFNYQKQNISNTYLFVDEMNRVKCFFSISNDCLNDLGEIKGFTNSIWNRFHRKRIPNEKRIRQYPAVKIGRLGVDKSLHRSGIGSQMLDFIKGWTFVEHKPACRLLLLDAYNQEKQVNYYIRNDFRFLLDMDEKDTTRIMYFDLSSLL